MGEANKKRDRYAAIEAVAALAQSLTIFVNPAVRVAVAERMVKKGLAR